MSRQRRQAGWRIVEEQTRRQVRTFLDELRNGTRNYRTVASLRGQVAQEYRGRAVMELLQNSHDVLAVADDDDPRRISFVLRRSPEPELLVANSGRPFRHEDFIGICQLAQSPKDPNESVGNKGLGFQSVLELSTRPEVWSTAPTGSDVSFAFGFDPGVRDPIARVAGALANGEPPTDGEFGSEPVVEWSGKQVTEYLESLEAGGLDLQEEVDGHRPCERSGGGVAGDLLDGEKDETSDSHGYDFRFTYEGITWCVEVKATTGHGTSFDLPSSELDAASRIAPRKDERWRILRVRMALSEHPEFDWLPNPFEPGSGELLRLRQGGVTVEYTRSDV